MSEYKELIAFGLISLILKTPEHKSKFLSNKILFFI